MRRATLALIGALMVGGCSAQAVPKVEGRDELIARMRHEERLCSPKLEGRAYYADPHCKAFDDIAQRLEREFNLCMMNDTLYIGCLVDAPYPETH